MNPYLENDYDSDDNDSNLYKEYTADILAEFEEDKKIAVVQFYKEKLSKEPEFIGIKNISCGKILNIIENTNNLSARDLKLYKNINLSVEQYYIFNDMYSELNNVLNNKKNLIQHENIYYIVINKIFDLVYIN